MRHNSEILSPAYNINFGAIASLCDNARHNKYTNYDVT